MISTCHTVLPNYTDTGLYVTFRLDDACLGTLSVYGMIWTGDGLRKEKERENDFSETMSMKVNELEGGKEKWKEE